MIHHPSTETATMYVCINLSLLSRTERRDLKSDNILLDLSEESDNCPSLVVTDFGCCLADKSHGLYLPFNTHDIDKGGNVALMAPEVITAQPGPFASLNYTKADVWTVGAIAYEIFGMKNPFYDDSEKATLKNYNYTENSLPELPPNVPSIVSAVIKSALSRNLRKVCIFHIFRAKRNTDLYTNIYEITK